MTYTSKKELIDLRDSGQEVESKAFIDETVKWEDTFIPNIDFSDPSTFAKYGLAEKYYIDSINYVRNFYPYDGSLAERQKWYNESSYLDKYVFDSMYPRNNGHISISATGWGTQAAVSSGVGLPSLVEYIEVHGGPNVNKDTKIDGDTSFDYDKSNILDSTNDRESNLEFGSDNTVEFYLKKSSAATLTNEEVVCDIWNKETYGTSNYARLTIVIDNLTPDFNVIYKTSNTGYVSTAVSGGNLSFDGNWHHWAFVFDDTSNSLFVYMDGSLVNTVTSLASTGGLVQRNIVGIIGSYQAPTVGNTGLSLGYGKLEGSLDEFRFWKTARTDKEVGRYYNFTLGGGTNTDDSNVGLGIYFRFNEGIVGNSSFDSNVVDYSGRNSNGTWVGYTTSSRDTTSAMVVGGFSESEFEDPVLYKLSPDYIDLVDTYQKIGEVYDLQNTNNIYNNFIHSWYVDEDIEYGEEELKTLSQIIGSYFDTLFLQIQHLPSLKTPDYSDANSFGNIPYGAKLLNSVGFVSPDLFSDASIFEKYFNRDDDELYESKIHDIKQFIYTNIYNNISHVFKSKGTTKAFADLIRCFGIDDSVLNLQVYADNFKYDLDDVREKNVEVRKKFVTAAHSDNHDASIYGNKPGSDANEKDYIPDVGTNAKHVPITFECDTIFPKLDHDVTFTKSSIFGSYQPDTLNPEAFAVTQLSDFQVYAERDSSKTNFVRFTLESTGLSIASLDTDYYEDVYEGERWYFTVKVHNESKNMGVTDYKDYYLTFNGYNVKYGEVVQSFSKVTSLTSAAAVDFLNKPKRLYALAQRADWNGTVLTKSDVSVGAVRMWWGDLSDETMERHAVSPDNIGTDSPMDPFILGPASLDGYNVPQIATIVLQWTFDTNTTLSTTTIPYIYDTSGGDAGRDGRYVAWIDSVIAYRYPATGIGFTEVDPNNVYNNEYLTTTIQMLPENVNGNDMIVSRDYYELEKFDPNEEPITYVYSFEKSMYRVISEEMVKFFGVMSNFSNLIGRNVDRYRLEYKRLNKLRKLFFEKISNEPDLEKFVTYYRWIDKAVGIMLNELIPASTDFVEGVNDVVESHILERSKHFNKFPTINPIEQEELEGQMISGGERLYNFTIGTPRYSTTPIYKLGSSTSLLESNIGYYKFDENISNTIVKSSYGGVYGESSIDTKDLHDSSGRISSCFNFNPANESVTIPVESYPGKYFSLDKPFSIAGWLKPDNLSTNRFVLGTLGASGTDGLAIVLLAAGPGKLYFTFRYGAAYWRCLQNITFVSTGGWSFITCTYDGSGTISGMKTYVNTIEDSNLSSSGLMSSIDTSDPIVFANDELPTWVDFDGSMDEFGFWSKVLSPTEITELYNSSAGITVTKSYSGFDNTKSSLWLNERADRTMVGLETTSFPAWDVNRNIIRDISTIKNREKEITLYDYNNSTTYERSPYWSRAIAGPVRVSGILDVQKHGGINYNSYSRNPNFINSLMGQGKSLKVESSTFTSDDSTDYEDLITTEKAGVFTVDNGTDRGSYDSNKIDKLVPINMMRERSNDSLTFRNVHSDSYLIGGEEPLQSVYTKQVQGGRKYRKQQIGLTSNRSEAFIVSESDSDYNIGFGTSSAGIDPSMVLFGNTNGGGDPDSNSIEVDASTSLHRNPNDGESISVSCWIKMRNNTGFNNKMFIFTNGIFGFAANDAMDTGTAGPADPTIWCYSSNAGGTEYREDTGVSLSDGLWHHALISITGNALNPADVVCWVDGVKVADYTESFANNRAYSTNRKWTFWHIYNKSGTTQMYFDGSIDNCTVWDTDLVESDMNEIYMNGDGRNCFDPSTHSKSANLMEWWSVGAATDDFSVPSAYGLTSYLDSPTNDGKILRVSPTSSDDYELTTETGCGSEATDKKRVTSYIIKDVSRHVSLGNNRSEKPYRS